MVKPAAVLAVALLLCGCSVAALVEDDNLDKRMQALEARVHALEMASVKAGPPSNPAP